MVTYPVVPEICRRQVHVPKKERRKRRKRIIIKITRYDYNQVTIRGAILRFKNFRDVCHFQNGCQNTA
jgi:hypothetical protein